MSKQEVNSYQPGSRIHLVGYTSTSKSRKSALKFAFKNLKEKELSVLYRIEFKGKTGLFEMTSEYTAFPVEEEVLVQDGLRYSIMSIVQKLNK